MSCVLSDPTPFLSPVNPFTCPRLEASPFHIISQVFPVSPLPSEPSLFSPSHHSKPSKALLSRLTEPPAPSATGNSYLLPAEPSSVCTPLALPSSGLLSQPQPTSGAPSINLSPKKMGSQVDFVKSFEGSCTAHGACGQTFS